MLTPHLVAAVVTFGTVRRSPSEPYSVGPGKDFQPEALRTDDQKTGINQYASILRDYCNTGDQYCAKSSSPLDLEFHLTYFEQYQPEVVSWVLEIVKKGQEAKVNEEVEMRATSVNKGGPKTATCTKGGVHAARSTSG